MSVVHGARVGIDDDCDYTKLQVCEVDRITLHTFMQDDIDTFKASEGELLEHCG